MELQFFKDEAGGWRFRIRAGNGEIVATSESYTRINDAHRGFDTLAELFAEANAPGG
jgi:uncharacterized protein YegP (UPF0339 family)